MRRELLLEGQLIDKAKKGDRKALEKLLQSNYSILKGYLIKLTNNRAVADDITQETMMKAIINIKKYKPTGKFSTWLITIATNLYRDMLRKDKRIEFDGDNIPKVDLNNLEESVIIKTEIDKMKSILSSLSEDKRMVVILKHYYGYSYKEIADILNCPIGTVRSKLHYGIKEIKDKMEDVNDNE